MSYYMSYDLLSDFLGHKWPYKSYCPIHVEMQHLSRSSANILLFLRNFRGVKILMCCCLSYLRASKQAKQSRYSNSNIYICVCHLIGCVQTKTMAQYILLCICSQFYGQVTFFTSSLPVIVFSFSTKEEESNIRKLTESEELRRQRLDTYELILREFN